MTTAAEVKPISRELLKCLQTVWPRVEMNLSDLVGVCGVDDSRSARLGFASHVLARPVHSFNDLSMKEGLELLARFKQETGEEMKPAGYRGARRPQRGRIGHPTDDELLGTGRLALELFGERWQDLLNARVQQRFGAISASDLTGGQTRSLVEELLQRIAVRDIQAGRALAGDASKKISRAEIEKVKAGLRNRFFHHRGTEANQ